jgi:CDP-diglyceride synthetase
MVSSLIWKTKTCKSKAAMAYWFFCLVSRLCSCFVNCTVLIAQCTIWKIITLLLANQNWVIFSSILLTTVNNSYFLFSAAWQTNYHGELQPWDSQYGLWWVWSTLFWWNFLRGKSIYILQILGFNNLSGKCRTTNVAFHDN